MTSVPPPGDVRGALAELGIGFYMNGSEAVCLCPFHDDRKAGNFSVNIKTGMSNCFACGKGGGFWRIVQAVKGCTSDEAVRWCRTRVSRAAVSVPEVPAPARKSHDQIDTTTVINEASLALFTAPPRWACAERWLELDACAELGLLWDPREASWIIPIRNAITAQLMGWQEKAHDGRYFRNHPRQVRKSRSLFGLHAAGPGSRLILVESPLDAARFYSAGIHGAVSAYGARLSEYQLSCITEWGTDLVLALDNDPAGLRATQDVAARYRRLPVVVFNYGKAEGKDPGELTAPELHWGLEHATSALMAGAS